MSLLVNASQTSHATSLYVHIQLCIAFLGKELKLGKPVQQTAVPQRHSGQLLAALTGELDPAEIHSATTGPSWLHATASLPTLPFKPISF